jgi:hypothetical protein
MAIQAAENTIWEASRRQPIDIILFIGGIPPNFGIAPLFRQA